MKILIIQTAFIGDVVLATPIIEKLKSKYPSASIDFLVRKGNESIFDQHPKLNKVLVFDKKKSKYKNLIHLIRVIRSASYDYVINAQRFFTSGLITVLSGGKTTIGFDKNPLSFLFTHQYKHKIDTQNPNHEIERNLTLIASLTDNEVQKPKLYPTTADKAAVPTDYEYVCIAPASNWYTKQLPFEKWCALIRQLPQQYKVHLIGAPQDIALCEKIQAATDKDRVVISAGQLSILESVALIQQARMTFSNDSAPLHFASAVNAPVTAIFCSTIPEFGFGPLSNQSVVAETDLQLACRPCGLHGKKECPKGHFNCADINIDKLLNEAGMSNDPQ